MKVFGSVNRQGLLPALLIGAFLLGVVSLSSKTAEAQSRWVVVNGQQLNDRQIADVEATYGIHVANGDYWFHPPSGAWGYTGNSRIQGYLRVNSGSGAGVGDPGYNRNTAGGGMMSDGQCAFVLGVPAGNC